jgi:hypothetical protein
MAEKFRSKGCKGGFFRAQALAFIENIMPHDFQESSERERGEWTSSECECVYATLLTTWRFSPFHPFHDQIKREEVTRGYVWRVCVRI